MPVFSRRQRIVLALLALVWGLNWPIMKVGVTGFPPLTFRALSLWLGEPLYWQDWAAMLLMVLAIASVLWPQRAPHTLRA